MLDQEDVIEAVSLDLLEKGYAILNKPGSDHEGADIVARDSRSGAKIFVSAAGAARSEAGRGKLEAEYTETQLFRCVARSVHGAMRLQGEDRFNSGDHIALAFPDIPGCRKYLDAEKPVLEALGIKVFLVGEDKKVAPFK